MVTWVFALESLALGDAERPVPLVPTRLRRGRLLLWLSYPAGGIALNISNMINLGPDGREGSYE